MPDDIAHWKIEREKLPTLIQFLRTRIGDIDRHIASLQKRRI